MATWTNGVNEDGLKVRFGLDRAANAPHGELEVDGDLREIIVSITDATAIPATAASTVITDFVSIPSGARIESVDLYVSTAFTSAGAATLDVGLFNDNGDGTYTVSDANGLMAAADAALSALVSDAKISGTNGAVVGTTITGTAGRPQYVSYGYATAAFTAGAGELVIRYRV